MDKSEYRVEIIVQKAPLSRWWGKLWKKRYIHGLKLGELHEINWNRIILRLIEEIEDEIKTEEEKLKIRIDLEE